MSRKPFGFDAVGHERHHGWRSLLFKVALGSAATWFAWYFGDWVGLLISLTLWARLLADDLMALLLTFWRGLRGLGFRPVQGRFYQFKGHRIRVEDDDLLRQRWLAVEDLATALGLPVTGVSLRRRWPDGVRQQADGVYLLDETALAWLGEQRSERAGRLRAWVEREVWYPARGRRASYTQKGAPAGAPSDSR